MQIKRLYIVNFRYLLIVSAVFLILYFGGRGISGLAVFNPVINETIDVNQVFNTSDYYEAFLGKPTKISAVRIDGSYSGQGNFRIYLETGNKSLLVYEKQESKKSNLLTGLAIADTSVGSSGSREDNKENTPEEQPTQKQQSSDDTQSSGEVQASSEKTSNKQSSEEKSTTQKQTATEENPKTKEQAKEESNSQEGSTEQTSTQKEEEQEQSSAEQQASPEKATQEQETTSQEQTTKDTQKTSEESSAQEQQGNESATTAAEETTLKNSNEKTANENNTEPSENEEISKDNETGSTENEEGNYTSQSEQSKTNSTEITSQETSNQNKTENKETVNESKETNVSEEEPEGNLVENRTNENSSELPEEISQNITIENTENLTNETTAGNNATGKTNLTSINNETARNQSSDIEGTANTGYINTTRTNITENNTTKKNESIKELSERFSKECIESCNMNIKTDKIRLRIEIEGNITLHLSKIEYYIPENEIQKEPILIKQIPDIEVRDDKTTKINLKDYFDGVSLKFGVDSPDVLSVKIVNGTAYIKPKKPFKKKRITFYAANKYGSAESNDVIVKYIDIQKEMILQTLYKMYPSMKVIQVVKNNNLYSFVLELNETTLRITGIKNVTDIKNITTGTLEEPITI